MQEAGRPILVGTVSVEKSEKLGALLERRGIKHEVLNAKFHEKESGIVAQAGRTGAVTIATNMAGRGTDILLGGNPAGLASELLHRKGLNPAEVDKDTYAAALAEAKAITEEDHQRVVAAGGLHIVGTERHESRRIDNQLRGRAGRQGDPGSSRFYLSLDDDLMKRFASERVAGLMERMGLDEDNYIESGIVGKTIESAQSRVEGFNFDLRKRVVEFDDVINKQRETIYAERDKVLRNEDLTETIRAFLDEDLEEVVERHLGDANEAVTEEGLTDLLVELGRMGLGADRIDHDELLRLQVCRRGQRARPRGGRRAARDQGGRGRAGGVGDRRAVRAASDDRLAVGRAPDRARRHAPGHRPSRLRPAGPAQRVPEGGVPPLRGAVRVHPAPGREHDLPGDAPAAAPAASPACSRCRVRASVRRARRATGGNGRATGPSRGPACARWPDRA